MYDLTLIFKKYLREYSTKILEAKIPKLQQPNHPSISNSMSLLTKDFQNLSTAAGQVIHNFLKEGETPRYTMDDIRKICYILVGYYIYEISTKYILYYKFIERNHYFLKTCFYSFCYTENQKMPKTVSIEKCYNFYPLREPKHHFRS